MRIANITSTTDEPRSLLRKIVTLGVHFAMLIIPNKCYKQNYDQVGEMNEKNGDLLTF